GNLAATSAGAGTHRPGRVRLQGVGSGRTDTVMVNGRGSPERQSRFSMQKYSLPSSTVVRAVVRWLWSISLLQKMIWPPSACRVASASRPASTPVMTYVGERSENCPLMVRVGQSSGDGTSNSCVEPAPEWSRETAISAGRQNRLYAIAIPP